MLVKGDPGKLRQALMNLLDNAIKFTHKGQIVFRIGIAGPTQARLSDSDRKGYFARLRFDIEDTGIGIPRVMIATLFAPFIQGDATNTRCFGGTGLGLAISKKLIELMNGAISVESTEGMGSRFSVEVELETPILVNPTNNAFGVVEFDPSLTAA